MTLTAPVIILVHPQLGENIGAVARAMSNFGLKELRLVAPRDGWPSQRARDTASGGEAIIDRAKTYPDTAAAMTDIHYAYAATARERDMEKPVAMPAEAAVAIHKQTAKKIKTALVFGPERTGLENEDVVLCDMFITIPTDPGHFSLNLAQAVVVIGYEWWKIYCHSERSEESQAVGDPSASPQDDNTFATKEEWSGLFSQLEDYLDDVRYFRVAHKKPIMWQNLQNMLLRGAWNRQEVRTFRGMLRLLFEKPRPPS